MRENWKELPLLLVAAALLLLAGLGGTALWGSEDRWAEIARMMIANRDFFHPCINGEIYFDKPLLSYWLIAFPALVAGGVTEFMIRLPSALAALAALLSTYWLGTQLRNKGVGLLAGWLLLTSLGFIFWARKGAADLENLAAIILAVAWYCHIRERAGFRNYLVFGLICVIGAHTKGLPAIGVPLAAVLPDLLRRGNWKKHLNWKVPAAAAVCLIVYLIPFVLAAVAPLPAGWQVPSTFDALTMPVWAEPYRKELCGLYLVWKENVLRFFQPFDHQEPFYSYLIHVPRILLPWTLLAVAALVWNLKHYRQLDPAAKWMLEAAGLVFLLFTASGSRRWYYILPILPFLALVIALFLDRVDRTKWRDWLYRFHQFALVLIGAVVTLTIPLYFGWRALLRGLASYALNHHAEKLLNAVRGLQQFNVSAEWQIGLTVIGILALLPWCWFRRRPETFAAMLPAEPLRPWAPLMLSAAVLTFGLYVAGPLILEPYRTEKSFAAAVARRLQTEPAGLSQAAFYHKAPPAVLYYMKTAAPVPVVSPNAQPDKDEEDAAPLRHQLRPEALAAAQPPIKYLIVPGRYFKEAAAALPSRCQLIPVVAESCWPWENHKKKLSLYRITQK